MNIDASLKNADWSKRTPDKFEDLVQKYDPNQPRDAKGQFAETPGEAATRFKLWQARRQAATRAAEYAYQQPEPDTPKQQHTTAVAMKAEPLPKTLAEAEDRIRHEATEHVFLIRDGKPFMTLGNDDSHHVRMNEATPDDLKDVVLTHNHPSGYGLSNQDAMTAAKRNLLEMRVVTASGTYSIRRTGEEWPSNFHGAVLDQHHELMTELGMRLHDNDISVHEANVLHHKLMYTRLQKKLGGFVYTYEPRTAD